MDRKLGTTSPDRHPPVVFIDETLIIQRTEIGSPSEYNGLEYLVSAFSFVVMRKEYRYHRLGKRMTR